MTPETVSRTATLAMPGEATSVLMIWAVSLLEETNAVVRNSPFHVTTSVDRKFDPFTVSVKAAPSDAAVGGLSDEITRLGLPGGSMLNDTALEVPPPGAGFVTVIWTTFWLVTKEAGTEASSSVVSELRFVERGMPFQKAMDAPEEPDMKFVPLMKSMKPWLPAVIMAGKTKLMAGVGLVALLPLPPPQPARGTNVAASKASAVHRERVNRMLP